MSRALPWLLLAPLCLACAGAPAVPPTAEAVKSLAASEGPASAHQRYAVQVTGNAFFGHEVRVGQGGETAPARLYFAQAPFEVDHTNDWANLTSTLLTGTGSLLASVSGMLMAFDVLSPIDSLMIIGGCSLPMICAGYGFSVIGEWGMPEAGEDYNRKLDTLVGVPTSGPTPVAMEY